jgi:hypothetical protein
MTSVVETASWLWTLASTTLLAEPEHAHKDEAKDEATEDDATLLVEAGHAHKDEAEAEAEARGAEQGRGGTRKGQGEGLAEGEGEGARGGGSEGQQHVVSTSPLPQIPENPLSPVEKEEVDGGRGLGDQGANAKEEVGTPVQQREIHAEAMGHVGGKGAEWSQTPSSVPGLELEPLDVSSSSSSSCASVSPVRGGMSATPPLSPSSSNLDPSGEEEDEDGEMVNLTHLPPTTSPTVEGGGRVASPDAADMGIEKGKAPVEEGGTGTEEGQAVGEEAGKVKSPAPGEPVLLDLLGFGSTSLFSSSTSVFANQVRTTDILHL